MEIKTNQNLITRAPVVVILGHIDHGKTSLLSRIRKLEFTPEKPGGVITQHIGAFEVEKDGKKITFLDTPGHEAFSAIRARGAKVADIAILIIDACEGVKAQTREAISHIKKSGIQMIVALNKIDKPEANPEKVKKELAKENILVEDLGGKIPSVKVSAKTGEGIEELLELILLVAEMEDLKTDLQTPAEGVIIESYLDTLRGPTVTLILNKGILKKGNILATPSTFGKVKSLENFQEKPVEEILPSEPAIVIGFENPPKVGEVFQTFDNFENAKNFLKIQEKPQPFRVLEILPNQKVLNLILKADVLGSLEAIEEILKSLPQEKVILRILKSEVGEINESDIKLAKGDPVRGIYPALILGFRVKTGALIKSLAEREKIKIITFEVIYDLVERVRKFMEILVEPEIIKSDLGKIKVLAFFSSQKNRQIVGGRVIEGEVKKGAQIEIIRGEEIIGRGKLINLQHDKKDIEKVLKGQECGILYEGEGKIEQGDILRVYQEGKKKAEL